MKLLIAILFTFPALFCSGQGIDSMWIVNNRMEDLTRDVGIVIPGLKFIDEKGKQRTLEEFRGKILYIDMWTTWCVNCIDRIPFSKRLMKRLQSIHLDTSIVFINICTEDSEREWKKILKEHRPEGINLYCKDTSINKLWKIAAFPTYVLVDRFGKSLSFRFYEPDDASIDFGLYAATKGMKPAESAWIEFRQNRYRQLYRKFTDDDEGKDYANWYYSIENELIEYFKWRQARQNSH